MSSGTVEAANYDRHAEHALTDAMVAVWLEVLAVTSKRFKQSRLWHTPTGRNPLSQRSESVQTSRATSLAKEGGLVELPFSARLRLFLR
jgi:hypothetical protein